MNGEIKNVVLYLRYSSAAQNEQSIEGQRHVCQEYCRRAGYQVMDEYVDRATSASHNVEKRLNFQRCCATPSVAALTRWWSTSWTALPATVMIPSTPSIG